MHCVELGLTHVSLIFIDFSLQDAPDAEIIHTLSLYMRSERSVDFAGFRTVLPSVHCRRSKSTNFAEFLQSSDRVLEESERGDCQVQPRTCGLALKNLNLLQLFIAYTAYCPRMLDQRRLPVLASCCCRAPVQERRGSIRVAQLISRCHTHDDII